MRGHHVDIDIDSDTRNGFALFDDNPSLINDLEKGFDAVTPAVLQKTAEEYLRPGNRTVYVITPGKSAAPDGKEAR